MDKELLKKLYIEDKKSMTAVGRELGCSRDKVSWWMNKYNIEQRTKSDIAYLQHNPNGDNYKIKEPTTTEDYFLLGLGLGLFWGEGNKVSIYSVRLGNTDPDIILQFTKFLREYCGVPTNKIAFGLQIFNDINKDEALSYWMEKLNCGLSSFHKTIVVIPPQGKGTYKRKSQYGVIQIYVNNRKLKEWISGKIDELRVK